MKESQFRLLSEQLIEAQKENCLKSMIKFANQLQEPFKYAYYDPTLLQDRTFAQALKIVRKLQRAQYLKPPRVQVFSGGLPTLGKRR